VLGKLFGYIVLHRINVAFGLSGDQHSLHIFGDCGTSDAYAVSVFVICVIIPWSGQIFVLCHASIYRRTKLFGIEADL
jgi:hypothetical protein